MQVDPNDPNYDPDEDEPRRAPVTLHAGQSEELAAFKQAVRRLSLACVEPVCWARSGCRHFHVLRSINLSARHLTRSAVRLLSAGHSRHAQRNLETSRCSLQSPMKVRRQPWSVYAHAAAHITSGV